MKNRRVNWKNLLIAIGVFNFFVGAILMLVGALSPNITCFWIGVGLASPCTIVIVYEALSDIFSDCFNSIFPKI